MISKIMWGTVDHWRKGPKEHSFDYPVFFFALDLDELETLSIAPRLFAYERRAIFSVRNADYLQGDGSLREKIEKVLREHGQQVKPARITLFTSPRYFGYVFNPVSFFACFDEAGHVLGLITQVNNTFGETHIYPLVCEPSTMPRTWRFPKGFFVSPFFDTEGEYEVILAQAGDSPELRVDLFREGERVFAASMRGDGEPLTRARLCATLKRFPITSLLTMPRIHGQAMNLYFKVGAKVYERPTPTSPYTIRSRQGLIHRVRLWFLALLRRARA